MLFRLQAQARISVLALLFALATPASWAALPGLHGDLNPGAGKEASERIRVRVVETAPALELRGFDLAMEEGERRLKIANIPDRLTEWELRCSAGKIRALPIRKSAGRPMVVRGPLRVSTPAGFLTLQSQPYRGALSIYPNGNSCEAVNEVDVEKYLDGLVNAEFSSKWSEEAIAAQVIAARTYALHQMRIARAKKQHFDVDSTEKDQVYNGAHREDYRASRAVERTKGVVLTAGLPVAEPIKAFYHSTCGGHTEVPEKVWGRPYPGFKRRVFCGFCQSSPAYRWELDLAEKDLVSNLLAGIRAEGAPSGWPAGAVSMIQKGKLVGLRMVRASPDSRVDRVVMSWEEGGRKLELPIQTAKFRMWLGPSKFRSTDFEAVDHHRFFRRYWKFQGRGNGHGVGMCQWGAKIMGDRGYTATAILKHYYPDAKFTRLW